MELYEKAAEQQQEKARDVAKRNAHIKHQMLQERQGLQVNYTLYDKQAELFRHMRLSTVERYGRLRQEFWRLCENHLERPPQLATDYVLGRVYRHLCYIFDFESLLGQPEIEPEFYHFKREFDTKRGANDAESQFKLMVMQVYNHR